MSISVLFRTTKRRWSDNDYHFGPFTYSKSGFSKFGVMLDSGHDEYPGCCIRFYFLGSVLICELPPIIKPHREKKTFMRTWGPEEDRGEDSYIEESAREYGFFYSENSIHFHYGAMTHDSKTDHSKVWFIPFLNWRFARHSLYDVEGNHFWTENRKAPKDWDDFFEAKKNVPSVSFEFDDYDGERITARTFIEEREWHFGEGKFKWLSWFRKPMIRRSLDIEFSKETGRRKGSWKGGTIGHGIDLEPNEFHESAFRRYCKEHDMTFIGIVS